MKRGALASNRFMVRRPIANRRLKRNAVVKDTGVTDQSSHAALRFQLKRPIDLNEKTEIPPLVQKSDRTPKQAPAASKTYYTPRNARPKRLVGNSLNASQKAQTKVNPVNLTSFNNTLNGSLNSTYKSIGAPETERSVVRSGAQPIKPTPPKTGAEPQTPRSRRVLSVGDSDMDPLEAAMHKFEAFEKPLKPGAALKNFQPYLLDYEKGEILDYTEIYFLGLKAKKAKLQSGFDDDKGFYTLLANDHIAYRFEMLELLGKGSFGQVVKAFDHKTRTLVALKIIRNKQRFHRQAAVEIEVLDWVRKNDQKDTGNVIHMQKFFLFRNHVCITFEILSINLYEFLKLNEFRGLSMKLIKRFSIQILQGLRLFQKGHIIHCDMKPENILLRYTNKSAIKIIDLGSACFEDEKIYTYIQSRFYRAPEIMLGIPYTTAIDMWSMGCIAAELFVGFPLFPGESEHEQLLLIMQMLGEPPTDVYEQATRAKLFFDAYGSPIVKENSRGKRHYPGTKSLASILNTSDFEFLDFVSQCLEWNPAKRLTPTQALRHPWLLPKMQTQTANSTRRSSRKSSRHASYNSSKGSLAENGMDNVPHFTF